MTDFFLFLAASDTEELSGSVTDPALFTSSSSCNARLRADEELIRIMARAVNELRLEWSPLWSRGAISQQAGRVFSHRAKGGPVTKQRISRWLVDAITLAYSSLGLQCLIGVRAHSARGIASSWAWSRKCPFQTFLRWPAGPCHPHL